MEEDTELKLIERRKLAALRRKMEANVSRKTEKTDREVLSELLYDRGDEVLDAAYGSYPQETTRIVGELAKIIRDGKFGRKISGGELYALFREVGLRFQLKTSIKVQVKGKFVDLSERLKVREEE